MTSMDLYRTDDAYVLSFDLPGVTPSSIDVDVAGKVLTVRAERTARDEENLRWISRGRRTGTFTRRFTLGDGVDAAALAADYTDGVLTLTLPVAETVKPRKVEVTFREQAATTSEPQLESAAA